MLRQVAMLANTMPMKVQRPTTDVAAVIAAAGDSRRMGQCKALLPWHGQPAVLALARRLAQERTSPIVCVVGAQRAAIEAALAPLPVRIAHNAAHATSGLLDSYQVGIRTLQPHPRLTGALLSLVDQPHIPSGVYQALLQRAHDNPGCVIRPRHLGRCGHPFYLPASLWDALLRVPAGQTMRDFLRAHRSAMDEVEVQTDAILLDLDTPQDYERLLSRFT